MTDKWRLACPENNGHRALRHRNKGGYYCRSCQEYYEKVLDLKTGRMVSSTKELN